MLLKPRKDISYEIEDFMNEGNETTKDENKKWNPFLKKALHKMHNKKIKLPEVKKATGQTHKFQVTGHSHIADALQGYWERNKKTYTHRAKSDYRALYLGTQLMLLEEELLTGVDNSKDLTKLETFLKEKEYRHKNNKVISSIRNEIRTCIKERENGEITHKQCLIEIDDLIEAFSLDVGFEKATEIVLRIAKEEEIKEDNYSRQSIYRDTVKKYKGISSV